MHLSAYGHLKGEKKTNNNNSTSNSSMLCYLYCYVLSKFPSFFVCVVLKTIVALNSSVSASASFCAYILRFFWEKGFHSKNGNRVFFFRRSSDGLLTTVRGKLNVLSCESSLWQTPTNLR